MAVAINRQSAFDQDRTLGDFISGMRLRINHLVHRGKPLREFAEPDSITKGCWSAALSDQQVTSGGQRGTLRGILWPPAALSDKVGPKKVSRQHLDSLIRRG